MEACLRGFSYIPETKIEIKETMDLQYIQGSELERTWKNTRRERMKQREQKIWNDFVLEQDIVRSVCDDDPYQFLESLPEPVLKELMEAELHKMRQEVQEDNKLNRDQKSPSPELKIEESEQNQHVCTVTFAGDDKTEEGTFQIFEDNANEKEDELSEPEEEDGQIDSPCTVREGNASHSVSPDNALDTKSSKSSVNVSNVIESSIYCAKLKDLRLKINEELLAIITTLETINVIEAEREDIARMCKRSLEFCARFNRIHMYQLQRQMQDIKRNNSVSLPFAKHTLFQAQMVRIVGLHQNLLQACQVFHKSLEQTACLGESSVMLPTLTQTCHSVTTLCSSVPPPPDFAAAQSLYDDELLTSSNKLNETVKNHTEKYSSLFAETTKASTHAKTTKLRRKKNGFMAKPILKDTDRRLSMYSIETRINSKSSGSKIQPSGGTSKIRLPLGCSKRGQQDKTEQAPKTQRKSPRSRRPLMRDPHAGRPRAPRPLGDTDIQTMVEAVEACASSHISREPSLSALRSKQTTPRPYGSGAASPRKSLQNTPRGNFFQDPRSHPRDSPRKRTTVESFGNYRAKEKNVLCNYQGNLTSTSKTYTARANNFKRNDFGNISKKDLPLKMNNESNKTLTKENKYREVDAQSIDGEARNDSTYGIKDPRSPRNNEALLRRKEYQYKNEVIEELDSKEDTVKSEVSSSHNTHVKSDNSQVTNAERDRSRMASSSTAPARCEVTRLIKQLCSGDGSVTRTERIVGSKNAQLVCVTSPRQPSTPQLLRILEETIQKKVPKPLFAPSPPPPIDVEKCRLVFNISEQTARSMFHYRTKFVQHMLSSPMYANSAIGKPWELVGSVSDQIIEDLLLDCAKEMQMQPLLQELFDSETN